MNRHWTDGMGQYAIHRVGQGHSIKDMLRQIHPDSDMVEEYIAEGEHQDAFWQNFESLEEVMEDVELYRSTVLDEDERIPNHYYMNIIFHSGPYDDYLAVITEHPKLYLDNELCTLLVKQFHTIRLIECTLEVCIPIRALGNPDRPVVRLM